MPVRKKSATPAPAPAAKKAPPAKKAAVKKTAPAADVLVAKKKTVRPPAPTPTAKPARFGGIELVKAIADAADSKKAESISVLDVRKGVSMVTDFLIICSGGAVPHLRAIRDEIVERIREDHNERPHSAEGVPESQWMLLDYGDVVVHLFLPDARELFALEDLWGDAPRLNWKTGKVIA